MVGAGLRERKKRQTRQRISDAATALFVLRGFDQVTVTEIAQAADVSKMTVFNYFPRKEDLFFDRTDEARELLERAIRDRPTDTSIPEALRGLMLDLAARRHPLSGLRDGVQPFWRVVLDSPALQVAGRDAVASLETFLTALITADAGVPPDTAWPRLVAGFAVTAFRTVYTCAARRVLAGEPADEVYPDYVALVDEAFGMLDRAVSAPP